MIFFCIIQLILSFILLLCVITFGVSHIIMGTISFYGVLVIFALAFIMIGLVRLSYKEYIDEKNKQ
jgi:hypothetical protein